MGKVNVIYTKPPFKSKLVDERYARILVLAGAARVTDEEAPRPQRKRVYKRRDMQAEE